MPNGYSRTLFRRRTPSDGWSRFYYPLRNPRAAALLDKFQAEGGSKEGFLATYRAALRTGFEPVARRLSPRVTGRLARSHQLRQALSGMYVYNVAPYALFVRFRKPNFRGTTRVVPFQRALLDAIEPPALARALQRVLVGVSELGMVVLTVEIDDVESEYTLVPAVDGLLPTDVFEVEANIGVGFYDVPLSRFRIEFIVEDEIFEDDTPRFPELFHETTWRMRVVRGGIAGAWSNEVVVAQQQFP